MSSRSDDVAMRPELAAIRERLVRMFEEIPDHPPPEEAPKLVRQAEALVDGIGWLDTHPRAEVAEYKAWAKQRREA